jgi:hypothetical protein
MPSPQIVHGALASVGARHLLTSAALLQVTGGVTFAFPHSAGVLGMLFCGLVSHVSDAWFTVPSPQQFTTMVCGPTALLVPVGPSTVPIRPMLSVITLATLQSEFRTQVAAGGPTRPAVQVPVVHTPDVGMAHALAG